MKRANEDLRAAMKGAGIYQWQIADVLGISSTTFTVKLRHELAADDKKAVLAAIKSVKKGV